MSGQGYVNIVQYWGEGKTGVQVVGGRQKSSSVSELESRRHLIMLPSFSDTSAKSEYLLFPFCATVLEPV